MSVMDAPDWQRIITGTGGTPPSIVAAGNVYGLYLAAGFAGLTMDPMAQTTGEQVVNEGGIMFTTFTAMKSATVQHIYFDVTGAAVCTANENFVGLYDWGLTTAATFTRLGQTAAGAIDTALDTLGLATATLTSSVTLNGGDPYAIAFLNNGARPSIAGTAPSGNTQLNPFNATFPVVTQSSAHTFTTLPATMAWSSTVTQTPVMWFLVGP